MLVVLAFVAERLKDSDSCLQALIARVGLSSAG